MIIVLFFTTYSIFFSKHYPTNHGFGCLKIISHWSVIISVCTDPFFLQIYYTIILYFNIFFFIKTVKDFLHYRFSGLIQRTEMTIQNTDFFVLCFFFNQVNLALCHHEKFKLDIVM